MAIREVREIGDEILGKQCKEVNENDHQDKDSDW